MEIFSKIKNIFKKEEWKLDIYAACDGVLAPITEIPDEAFSNGTLGEGFAIKPINNDVIAPMDGKVSVAYETGHAYYITDVSSEVSLLIHLGVDTVAIPADKKAFVSKVEVNDMVKHGDALVTMDLKTIRANAPSDMAIFLIQNENMENKVFSMVKEYGQVKKGDLVARVSLTKY